MNIRMMLWACIVPVASKKVAAALENASGVTSVDVTLKQAQATVEMDAHVPEETLNRAVQAAGGYGIAESNSMPSNAAVAESKQSLRPLFRITAYIASTIALVAI